MAWALRPLCPFFPQWSFPFNNFLVHDMGQKSTQGTQPSAGLGAHLPNHLLARGLRQGCVRKGASESLGGDERFKEVTSVGRQAVLGTLVLSAPRTAPLGATHSSPEWKSPALWGLERGAGCRPVPHLTHTQSRSHLWAHRALSRKCCLLSWPP